MPSANVTSMDTTPSSSAASSGRSTPSLPGPERAQAQVAGPPAAQRYSQQQHLDPLSRTYPKPEGEIDIMEALSRPSRKWTIGHWAKNAKYLEPRPRGDDVEAGRQLEETKESLRLAQSEIKKMQLPRAPKQQP